MAATENTREPTNTTRTPGESAEPEASNALAMLDLVLPDGTLGTLRRFWPDSSLVRYAARLATRPGTVARRAAKLTAELAGIATGSSAIAPARRDRRFADPAWSENPLLKRAVQTYLALGGTAEDLLADADLDWRDNTRLKFMLTNLVAASAPSNNPLISPAAWKSFIDTGGLSAVRVPAPWSPTCPLPRTSRPWWRPTRSRSARISP